MTDPIQDAIAAAQASAANVGTAPGTAVAPAAPVQGQVMNAPAAQPLSNSLADFGTGGLDVDGYIKVTEFGMLVPKEAKKPIEEFNAVIDLSDCVRHLAMKASIGDNTKYWRTYDGITDTEGKPWQQAIAEAQAIDPKAAPYESVDIPMVLLEDVGEAKAGDRLGYSLSTTNKKAFASFARSVAKAGLDLNSAVVQVKVGYENLKKGSWSWGIMTFSLIGEHTEQ